MADEPIVEGNQEASILAEKSDLLSAALLITLVISINAPVLTQFPSPGGDEPSFVDVAVTLITSGHLGSELHRDLLPGIDRHVYWQPPLYFLALAGWFRLVGIGLPQARSFSLISVLFLIIGVYALSRRYARQRPCLIASVLCLLLVSPAARFARMDALCVALTVWSVLSYLRARDSRTLSLFALSGILAACAFLSHPLGLAAPLILSLHLARDRWRPSLVDRAVALMAGCFVCGVLLWVAYAARDPQSFQLQMTAQLARKLSLGSYWQQFWNARTHVIGLLVVVSAGFWLAVAGWRSRASVIAFGFLVSFAAATYGREMGYFTYFYPWGCCAVAVLLNERRVRRSLLYAAVGLAILNEASLLGYNTWRYRNRDYGSLSRVVRQTVPPGASVFIGFPEVTPYFALVGRNPMRAAVPVKTPNPDACLDIARNSDFVAVSMPVAYLPEIATLLKGRQPVAIVDQGPGYRLAIFRNTSVRIPDR